MTWNGNTITGPVLIYHDEVLSVSSIGNPNRPGALVCKIDRVDTVAWYWPQGFFVLVRPSERDFEQLRTDNGSVSLLSRTTTYTPTISPNRNGLWTCRQSDEWIPIGLFSRGESCDVNFERPYGLSVALQLLELLAVVNN